MKEIRGVQIEDAEGLARIYNYYVEHTHHTFETEPLTVAEMEKRVTAISRIYPFLVAEIDGEIAGYAYASLYKPRPAYKFSVESSVYVARNRRQKNIGTQLYQRLIKEIFETEAHTIIAGIALPNEASRKLHENLGFVNTAHFREVGFKFGRWIDVGYWQLFKPAETI